MVEIIATSADHVEHVAANLRAADLAELKACGHKDAHRAVAMSLALSTHVATATADGEIGAVFGVAPVSMVAGVGCPWMLGTDLVLKHAREMLTVAPGYIQAMLRAYPHLTNRVHADNQFALRWLRRVGFLIHPATPHPETGAFFHRFEMRANHV